MSHKNPTTRQWKLVKVLKESLDGVTLKELADRFEVNERTIRRDLSALSKEFPIQESIEAHGRKLWSLDETPFVATSFNFEEATALYLGYRFLAPMANSFLWEAAQSGLQKIRDQLGTSRANASGPKAGSLEYPVSEGQLPLLRPMVTKITKSKTCTQVAGKRDGRCDSGNTHYA